uniref:Nitroreductase domain-containing protein n=1 Tax=Pyramimonas obovata TaxID=1411642 RepID=A0A7S0WR52_9CHLO|mmetsp:Transcript_35720/g.77964  ORF Transcript_35720/g.77964 Transcript_35720/m.77964 type:complete len:352 (+) Transcript_35720:72-1127(+)
MAFSSTLAHLGKVSHASYTRSSTTDHVQFGTRRCIQLPLTSASQRANSTRLSANGRLFESRMGQTKCQRSTLCVRAEIKASTASGKVDKVETVETDLEGFERVVKGRYTNKVYDKTRAIPAGFLEKCLGLCLRAPTSFNTQPYIALVVDDDKTKQALSECMLGEGNINRVLDAPATVVFAADNNCMRNVPKVMDLWLKDGAPAGFVKTLLPLYVALFSNGFGFFGRIPFIGSLINLIVYLVRKVALSIASFFTCVPTPSTAEAWSMKNAMFPATIFMLAASAAGLTTSPMEGYDSRRVRSALNLPGHYSVALAVSVGYPPAQETRRSSRFDSKDLVYRNTFGQEFPGIPAY